MSRESWEIDWGGRRLTLLAEPAMVARGRWLRRPTFNRLSEFRFSRSRPSIAEVGPRSLAQISWPVRRLVPTLRLRLIE